MPLVKARWLDIAAALTAASLFATSLWIGRWWTVGEVAIGPLGSQVCFGGTCRPGGLTWLGGTVMWQRAATATWAAGFLSMAGLIALAGGIAAGRLPTRIAKSSLVAIATAVIVSGYFVATFPGIGASITPAPPGCAALPTRECGVGSIGHGIGLYAAAAVLGLAAPLRILRAALRH